jgi:hypothetical protein
MKLYIPSDGSVASSDIPVEFVGAIFAKITVSGFKPNCEYKIVCGQMSRCMKSSTGDTVVLFVPNSTYFAIQSTCQCGYSNCYVKVKCIKDETW